jgi:hypothetical protein
VRDTFEKNGQMISHSKVHLVKCSRNERVRLSYQSDSLEMVYPFIETHLLRKTILS